jgi:hypothetical protein
MPKMANILYTFIVRQLGQHSTAVLQYNNPTQEPQPYRPREEQSEKHHIVLSQDVVMCTRAQASAWASTCAVLQRGDDKFASQSNTAPLMEEECANTYQYRNFVVIASRAMQRLMFRERRQGRDQVRRGLELLRGRVTPGVDEQDWCEETTGAWQS